MADATVKQRNEQRLREVEELLHFAHEALVLPPVNYLESIAFSVLAVAKMNFYWD